MHYTMQFFDCASTKTSHLPSLLQQHLSQVFRSLYMNAFRVSSIIKKMGHHPRRLDSFELRRLLPLLSGSHRSKYYNKAKPAFLRLLVVLFFIVVMLIFIPRLIFPRCPSRTSREHKHVPPCSTSANGTICCDRTAYRTDVCFVRGDVRTHSPSSSILLSSSADTVEEKIRPYTRKWENGTMSTIQELRLRAADRTGPCEFPHDAPAVVFSAGGFTGNLYHDFNDGLIPLYITSHQFNKNVVFVVVEFHDWWFSKYKDVLSRLSNYPVIDFSNDKRTHCFPEATVGLRIHGELAIDPSLMTRNQTIRDFTQVLHDAYKPRIEPIPRKDSRPKLVLISREGSRRIENEEQLVELAGDIGFRVKVLRPKAMADVATVYRVLSTCDVMMGVHGASLTHFLLMRPGTMLIQIVPLGANWAADAYYGEPARKLGLSYVRYEVLPRESSLYREYRKDNPVLADPESVNAKGWETTKRVYMNGQNVNLDLTRFRGTLAGAYERVAKKEERESLKEIV